MSEGPIFLTGVYRSGTTLPCQILNRNSKLSITFDTVQFFRFHFDKFNPIDKRYKEIIDEIDARLTKRYSISIPKDTIIKRIEGGKEKGYKEVYNAIMIESFCEGREDIAWGEKSVLEWTNIPTFLNMYPKGKIIHIIRDPRDVLASYREITIEPKHRYLDVTFACLHSMNWITEIGDTLPKDRYYILKHEDIVSMPEETTQKLCNFLEIEFESEMLDTAKYIDRSESQKWEPNTTFDDIKDGISTVSIDRWKTKLEPFEIIFVESIIGLDLLKRFGYEPSGITYKVEDLVELWEKIRLTPLLQDRLNNWYATGEGVESYPSDPTISKNWAENRPKDK